MEYVVDRVDTTATVWLGLTIGCARCHSHKFDPITQEDYYRLFAFFNNVPESGRAIKYGNSPPFIKAPTAAERRELDRLQCRLAEIERRAAASASRRSRQPRPPGSRRSRPRPSIDWSPDRHRIFRGSGVRRVATVRRRGRSTQGTSPGSASTTGSRSPPGSSRSAAAGGPSSRGWPTSPRARVTASPWPGAGSRSTWSSAGSTTPSGSRRRPSSPPADGRTSR